MQSIIKRAIILANMNKRKTITAYDILYSLKNSGYQLYGY